GTPNTEHRVSSAGSGEQPTEQCLLAIPYCVLGTPCSVLRSSPPGPRTVPLALSARTRAAIDTGPVQSGAASGPGGRLGGWGNLDGPGSPGPVFASSSRIFHCSFTHAFSKMTPFVHFPKRGARERRGRKSSRREQWPAANGSAT